jgi:hypothetical protein
MRTKSALVATLIAVSFLFGNLGFAENYKFRSVQNNSSLTMAFYRTDTVLVIVHDVFTLTEMDKKDIESYVFWEKDQKKPIYKYKSESEVSKTDCKKHILFYGSLSDFQRKDFLRIPVKKYAKGFMFNNQIFDQPSDAFFYINERSTRMYVCKNSNQAQHEFFSAGIGAYPLHIFRGNEIVITGVYIEVN